MTSSTTSRKLIADGFVPVKEAALYLGISPKQTYRLIHAGVLSHSLHGGVYVVPRAALTLYAQSRLVIGTVA